MGLDLTLIPEKYANGDSVYIYTKLDVDRDSDLFRHLKEYCLDRLDKKLYKDFEDGSAYVTDDAYGDDLTYIRAGLFKVIIRLYKTRPLTKYNKNVFRFIDGLHKDTKVILYWH